MSYRLKNGRSIAHEVRRIVHKQLVLATRELQSVGTPQGDAAVHEARRHVKKIRAAAQLVQPALGDAFVPLDRRMRTAGRLLAPIADGEAVVGTIDHLRHRFGRQIPRRTVASIRIALVERAARIDRKAELDRALGKAARLLRTERDRIQAWRLNAHGFRAVAPGIKKSFRRAKRAMARVEMQPTAERYHAWRQRVKDLWFQVRLLEGRCRNRLSADERRLEALDGCLGELHNLTLLQDVLVHEAVVSRLQTARCLRVLRHYQSQLQREAGRLGIRIFAEKTRHFRRRIKRLWQSQELGEPKPDVRTTWRRAA